MEADLFLYLLLRERYLFLSPQQGKKEAPRDNREKGKEKDAPYSSHSRKREGPPSIICFLRRKTKFQKRKEEKTLAALRKGEEKREKKDLSSIPEKKRKGKSRYKTKGERRNRNSLSAGERRKKGLSSSCKKKKDTKGGGAAIFLFPGKRGGRKVDVFPVRGKKKERKGGG